MRKKTSKEYLILITTLLFLMSLPEGMTQRVRGMTIAFIAPTCEQLGTIKLLASPSTWYQGVNKKGDVYTSKEEIQRLQLENQQLHSEIERLQELVEHELFVRGLLHDFSLGEKFEHVLSHHQKEIEKTLSLQLQAIPARVIYRSPSSWHSSLWLNVGSDHNRKLERVVIAKNSPVMMGTSIIGVVDYVGSRQCRVRLITDSGLTPAVRVARGTKNDFKIVEHIDNLLNTLEFLDPHALNEEQRKQLVTLLMPLKEQLLTASLTSYLAKGELSGSSLPIWRSQGQVLKGTGFNYDFCDSEGPARDLRTGFPLNSPLRKKPTPLINEHDLLVTTGMDGVFPPGLNVARVTSIKPLKEGDYFYEIEAMPTAGNLNEITMVMILPSVGFDATDRPPVLGW